MNTKALLICALAVVFCCAVQGSAQVRRTFTKIETINFGAGGSVSITGAPKGSIRVIGFSKNEVEITAEITIDAPSQGDLDKLSEISGFVVDEGTALLNIVTVGPHNKFLTKKLPKSFPKDKVDGNKSGRQNNYMNCHHMGMTV